MQKVDVAKEYVLDALRLYSEGRFFSALTLAGTAEEMLGKAIKRRGTVASAEDDEVDGTLLFEAQLSTIGTSVTQ
ncbi:MAG TPA: hypothetical protein VHW73_09600 [Rudaea sp.]|nr:hypothetical protein [Rudaea sp.]